MTPTPVDLPWDQATHDGIIVALIVVAGIALLGTVLIAFRAVEWHRENVIRYRAPKTKPLPRIEKRSPQ